MSTFASYIFAIPDYACSMSSVDIPFNVRMSTFVLHLKQKTILVLCSRVLSLHVECLKCFGGLYHGGVSTYLLKASIIFFFE